MTALAPYPDAPRTQSAPSSTVRVCALRVELLARTPPIPPLWARRENAAAPNPNRVRASSSRAEFGSKAYRHTPRLPPRSHDRLGLGSTRQNATRANVARQWGRERDGQRVRSGHDRRGSFRAKNALLPPREQQPLSTDLLRAVRMRRAAPEPQPLRTTP